MEKQCPWCCQCRWRKRARGTGAGAGRPAGRRRVAAGTVFLVSFVQLRIAPWLPRNAELEQTKTYYHEKYSLAKKKARQDQKKEWSGIYNELISEIKF
jgi:hypothetical protein